MRISDEVRGQLARRFEALLPHLNDRQQRLALATEARLLGHGGVRLVAQTARVSETTVRKGVFELEAGAEPLPEATPFVGVAVMTPTLDDPDVGISLGVRANLTERAAVDELARRLRLTGMRRGRGH